MNERMEIASFECNDFILQSKRKEHAEKENAIKINTLMSAQL